SFIANAVCDEAPEFSKKVKVIPNFVGHNGDPLEVAKRDKCILYVGRLHPEKGVHLLIEAFKKFLSEDPSGWKLRLIGPWEVAHGGAGEEYFTSLRKASQSIQNSVEWIGPVFDAKQLSAHYQQSSFLVYPSVAGRGEASPLAPLEAMAEGCPAVVSSLGCFRDYIRPGQNGWTFDESSPDRVTNLAATLRSVVSDPRTMEKVRAEAFQTAQSLGLSQIADRYLSDFQELVVQ
ncbi:MAG: glycosyltransferase family 4 protein, partial [Terracidiphilus sp.]